MTQWLDTFQPVRTLPRLWIETVWLLESREPFAVTRVIDLHPGLNIVWARESASNDAPGLSSAGHGVGKTSLCLLMRYVLGDDASPISTLREKAVGGFPKGGVAARVHVDGVAWLVFRPYGAHGHSLAAPCDSLELLFRAGVTNDFADYLEALEQISIGRLAARSLPGSNQPLRWRHLLAWCIRDQRTRFDGFFHWRDGEGLGFTRPRRDPPLFVGSVLGLVDAGLDQTLREIESKQSLLEEVKERIPELERAPIYALAHAERQLRLRLRTEEGEAIFETTVGLSMESRFKAAVAAASQQEGRWELEIEQTEERLAQEQLQLGQVRDAFQFAEVEVGIAQSLVNANRADFDRFTGLRDQLERLDGRCDHGDIEFSACQHIQNRKSTVKMAWYKDGREVQASAAERAQELARRQTEFRRLAAAEAELSERVSVLRVNLRRLRVRVATSESARDLLRQAWDDLQLLHKLRSDGSETAELVQQRTLLADLEAELNSFRVALAVRKSQQSSRAEAIKALTNCVSTRMLGTSGHARFVPESETRPFEVSRGGEAYQVFEVLLGDIVCLLDAATSKASNHPGFLVHDCPREADMSARLYREFFLTAAEAAAQLGGDEEVPFQFIVTTTSSPPESLQGRSAVVLELAADSEEMLLFRRELSPMFPGIEQ